MVLSESSCENSGADIVTIIVLVVGVIATFVAVVIIGKYSRKKFQKYVQEEEEDNKDVEKQAQEEKGDAKTLKEAEPVAERVVVET